MTNVTQQRMCPITSPFVASNYYVTKRSFNHEKIISLLLAAAWTVGSALFLSACSPSEGITIAVPNDTTNEARALLLLQENGYITLKEGAGITATARDIASNPQNIHLQEVEAAQLPNVLQDVDYAVINSNYAIEAGLNPMEDALTMEGASSAYTNVLVVKEGNEESDSIRALKAALSSRQVADYIAETYGGAVVSTVENPSDGYDASVDYNALAGVTITVAASPTPHAEILKIAQEILASKEITLDIKEFTDYIQPNLVVDSGDIDANYFQHTPYLDNFNEEMGPPGGRSRHSRFPMGLYGGKQTTLSRFKANAHRRIPIRHAFHAPGGNYD